LDNTRASLNYLAVELAKLAIARDPSLVDPAVPWKERLHPGAVEFPTFNMKAKFFDVGEDRIRKLPNEYRRAIQAEQPYNGSNKGLWDLQVLSAEYRHRVIHPVAIIPHRNLFTVVLDNEPVITTDANIHIDDSPIEHNTRIMDFRVVGLPDDRQGDVKPKITISIGLDHPLAAAAIA
jgi:hypothetical protein